MSVLSTALSKQKFNSAKVVLGDALQFYPEADRQRVSEILRVGIDTNAAWSFEADLEKADGLSSVLPTHTPLSVAGSTERLA